MNTSTYLTYSHKYNTGYVGRTANLTGFMNTVAIKEALLSDFMIGRAQKPVIYEIMQCDKADSMYYEGHIYDLIELHFPQITLINKNRPNRGKRESTKNWRNNNPERCKASRRNWNRNNSETIRENNKTWFESHPDYLKHWRETHPN